MGNDGTRSDAHLSGPRRRGAGVRIVAALLALLLAAGGVLAWRAVSTKPRRTRPDAQAAKSTESSGTTTPVRLVTTTTTTTTTTAPTTSAPAPAATGTGAVRVLEIGDSLGEDLGDAMESTWSPASVQLTMAARGDTGLTNSAYYDWPSALAQLLASGHPQVVVVLLGANDLQPMVTGSRDLEDGTPAWNAAYEARVTAVVSESVRAGARVLWVGEPAMQTAFINAGMTRLDGIAQRVVARHPGGAAYLSSNSVLAPDGSFTFDVTGPTGNQLQVRTPDGVHLMPTGADLLAAAVARSLARLWGVHVATP